jgi:hypothetical protein
MLIGKSMEYYAAGSYKMASFNGVSYYISFPQEITAKNKKRGYKNCLISPENY